MALALDVDATASLSATVRGAAWLVLLEFTTGTLRFTTAPVTVTALGESWLGVGNLLELAAVSESVDTAARQLKLSFTAANSAMLAASIGNVDTYRGRRVRVYLQLFGDTFQPVGAPRQRWAGHMDKVQITRQRVPIEGGQAVGRIEMLCNRAGMARARNAQGLRLTDAQQRQRYPGDTGLRYVQTLIEQPSTWLSKRFQEV